MKSYRYFNARLTILTRTPRDSRHQRGKISDDKMSLTVSINSKLRLIQEYTLGEDYCKDAGIKITLVAVAGSMLDFEGDACVNAANEGGVTGFGIDERVNRAGGPRMKEARKAFHGIATGQAKFTPSFDHKNVNYVIHAVGPVFRDNSLNHDPLELKFQQLKSAYKNAMRCAYELQCDSLAFCLISAGVFRGNVPLETIISLGIEGILEFYRENANKNDDVSKSEKVETSSRKALPSKVFLCAFTAEEQQALELVLSNLS